MGYRSDVAYVISFKTIDKREAFVNLMLAKNDENITNALKELGVEDVNDEYFVLIFDVSAVKWYETYPDVQAHHDLMDQARELFDADYRFVRVGEDQGDIEVTEGGENGCELWEFVDAETRITCRAPDRPLFNQEGE